MATNTALERKGAVLGVLTTAGFRDVLVVGRGNREKLYDIKATRPEGIVKRSRIVEVDERTGPDGEVLIPLDEAAVRDAAARFEAMGVECVAICFLHSCTNPEPERRAAAVMAGAAPHLPVTVSSEVLPEHREYERFATAALNAYVTPRMSGYLGALKTRLREAGLACEPEIMTSSGGSWTFDRMSRLPVNSMLSGPAGGVIGAAALAADLGFADVITCDMGGTSTDTAMIRGGRYSLANEGRIGGLPNRAPQIEINTVGAGGGSIAWLDTGGFLNVGPRSAGAVPGPACYGRGGTEPTVTDANVVLGRFRPAEALGGEIIIDPALSMRAVTILAGRLGLDPVETAKGIVRIAVTRMTGAIKEISVMRGLDPRDFALLAYGGAGALHAPAIAEELQIRTVIVPPLPGAFSAYGLLVADRRRDLSRTRLLPLESASIEDIEAMLAPMRDAARVELESEGFTDDRIRFESTVDVRFIGPPPPPPGVRADDPDPGRCDGHRRDRGRVPRDLRGTVHPRGRGPGRGGGVPAHRPRPDRKARPSDPRPKRRPAGAGRHPRDRLRRGHVRHPGLSPRRPHPRRHPRRPRYDRGRRRRHPRPAVVLARVPRERCAAPDAISARLNRLVWTAIRAPCSPPTTARCSAIMARGRTSNSGIERMDHMTAGYVRSLLPVRSTPA